MTFVASGAKRAWRGSHRIAIEDWLGAGAITTCLQGTRSPEARLAASAFETTRGDLLSVLQNCISGKELIEKGFPRDVELAAELNVSHCAPRLSAGAFRQC